MKKEGIILRTATEASEYYVNNMPDSITNLVNQTGKIFMEKYGREKALKICAPFMNNTSTLMNVEGLTSYLEKIGVVEINHSDPFDGSFEHEPYIRIK